MVIFSGIGTNEIHQPLHYEEHLPQQGHYIKQSWASNPQPTVTGWPMYMHVYLHTIVVHSVVGVCKDFPIFIVDPDLSDTLLWFT